jgi:hypothetical protein
MVRGSCLCGDVAWEASDPFELMSHCRCSMGRIREALPRLRQHARAASAPSADDPRIAASGSRPPALPEGHRIVAILLARRE